MGTVEGGDVMSTASLCGAFSNGVHLKRLGKNVRPLLPSSEGGEGGFLDHPDSLTVVWGVVDAIVAVVSADGFEGLVITFSGDERANGIDVLLRCGTRNTFSTFQLGPSKQFVRF